MTLPNTWEEYFSIRTDIIWYYGFFTKSINNLSELDQFCLEELGAFLMYGADNEWKPFSELWEEYKIKHGFEKRHENPDYSLKAKIRDMARDGFYFGKGLSYKIGTNGINEPIGVLLAQPVSIDFHNENHKEFFYKLFPFRFRYLPAERKIDFLKFHLKATFQNSASDYRLFLNTIKGSYREVFGDHFDLLNQYIDKLKGLPDKGTDQIISGSLELDRSFKEVTRKYTVKQIAFYLVCKDVQFENGKTEGIKIIAKQKNLKGYKSLLTQYTNLGKAGSVGDEHRKRFLKEYENQVAVRQMLESENNNDAISRLNHYINKLPITM